MDQEIERVFVARRPIDPGTSKWHKVGHLAHSALLLRTTDQKYHILEFMKDSKAHLYEIKLEVIRTIESPRPHEIFTLQGVEWTKQLHGKPLSGWTLDQAQSKMEELMKEGYSLSKYNVCHTAQEKLRQAMGIMEGGDKSKEGSGDSDSDPDPEPDPHGSGVRNVRVNELKMQGNTSLKNGDTQTAIKLYTEAIKQDPTNHVLYSNRSLALCKARRYERALQDAEKSIQLKANWTKGYYHKGTALTHLKRHSEAAEAYEQALKLEPRNEEIKTSLSAVNEKLMAKRIAAGLAKGSDIQARPPTRAQIQEERTREAMQELHSEKKIRTLLRTGNALGDVPPSVRKALANCSSSQSISSTEKLPTGTYIIHREKIALPNGAVRCLSLHTRVEFSHETVTKSGRVTTITRYYRVIYEWK